MKKHNLILLGCIVGLTSMIAGATYFGGTTIREHIDTSYKTGVIITTPNSEYLIELHYSDNLFKGVQTIELKPRLFVSTKVVRYIYTAPHAMHLWHWTIVRGDHTLYGETIDRDIKAGDDIQFIYVVD